MENLKDKKGFYKMYPKYNSGFLEVSNIHSIYFEEAGNPKGTPVIHLHGGPAYWNKAKNRKMFNPTKYRVILFDQRGGGRSTPMGQTKENTTQDLVEDIERLRKYLKLGKTIISGGSWGSTLALLYAQTYPNNVLRLLLRSVWLCRKADIEWIIQGDNLRKFFPDLWDERIKAIKELEIKEASVSKGLYRILSTGSFVSKRKAAAAIANWEDQFGRIYKRIDLVPPGKIEEKQILYAKLFLHFDINNYFLSENQILKNIHKITHIPTHIVHGRYDMICPVHQAWELHKKLPKSTLDIVQISGHSDYTLSKVLIQKMETTDK